MAFLSEVLNDTTIPQSCRNEAAACILCGEKIQKGGMWAGHKIHIGICKKCSPQLLDLYIDTLLDTGMLEETDDVSNVKTLCDDIIVRYKRKREKKEAGNKSHL